MSQEGRVQCGLLHFARIDPHAIAVIEPGARVWSRKRLFGEANRLSRAISAAGLKVGDCIAILSPNCIEYVQAYLAAVQIGLYVVTINPNLSQAEVEYILLDSGAKGLIAHCKHRRMSESALLGVNVPWLLLVSIGTLDGFTPLEKVVANHSDEPLDHTITGRLMTYTSATTGRPKGIELPLEGAQLSLERVIEAHRANGIHLEDDNVHLCASMLYHPAPLDWVVHALHMGHRVVLVEHWDAELLLRLIDEYAVTTTFMVPAMFIRMLKLSEGVRSSYCMESLRFVAHGAAPCPIEVKREMIRWFGQVIWESYGSSEGSGTVVSSADWLSRPGTVGRPFKGSRIAILDSVGNPVPPDVVGLVYLTRYTGERFRYRGDCDKTIGAYHGDLFTVGDIGYLDSEGYLFLCDRKIDMIISGGVNIYPAEIEQILVQHPQVADCAVFGIPDALMGEAVKAVVELQVGVLPSKMVTESIFDFLGSRVGRGKLPRRIEYAKALPRDPNGKLYKRVLRDMHWRNEDRQI